MMDDTACTVRPGCDGSVAGLLLMGGQSRRFGQDKAMLAWPGSSTRLWERQVGLLKAWANPVWRAVGPDGAIGPHVLVDEERGGGPLPAIRAALRRGPTWLVVLAVDLPLVEAPLFQRLWECRTVEGITLPEADGRIQPLAAVWHQGVLPTVDRIVAAGGRRVRDVVRAVPRTVVPLIGPDARWLLNINRPEDWTAAVNRLRSGGADGR